MAKRENGIQKRPRRPRARKNPTATVIDEAAEAVGDAREDARELREAATGFMQEIGALAGEAHQAFQFGKKVVTAFSILAPGAAEHLSKIVRRK